MVERESSSVRGGIYADEMGMGKARVILELLDELEVGLSIFMTHFGAHIVRTRDLGYANSDRPGSFAGQRPLCALLVF